MAISASRTLIGWIDVGFWLSALSSAFMMKRVEMPNMPSRLVSSCSSRADSFLVRPFSTTSSPLYRRSLVIRSHLAVGSSRVRIANIEAISSVCGAMWASKFERRRNFS